jgi:hypothetical protein
MGIRMTKTDLEKQLARLKAKQELLQQRLEEFDDEEDEQLYRDYLTRLVQDDVKRQREAQPSDVLVRLQQRTLRWLSREQSLSMKDWVLKQIGSNPRKLTAAVLRQEFEAEFGTRKLASLRQYLTKKFGAVKDKDGFYSLTSEGQRTYQKLSKRDVTRSTHSKKGTTR